jgi:hypothetical protein
MPLLIGLLLFSPMLIIDDAAVDAILMPLSI